MIPKSVQRFSEKIMLRQEARAGWRFNECHPALANGSSALPSRYGLTQAYAPVPPAAAIRAALHVAIGIWRLIAI